MSDSKAIKKLNEALERITNWRLTPEQISEIEASFKRQEQEEQQRKTNAILESRTVSQLEFNRLLKRVEILEEKQRKREQTNDD